MFRSFIKEKLRIFRGVIIVVLIFSWIFSGWPAIWLPVKGPSGVWKLQQTRLVRVAMADTAGPNSPGTDAGAPNGSCSNAVNWGDAGLVTDADDTSYMTITGNNLDAGELTDELQASNFGFVLVGTVTSIDGFQVEALGFTTLGGADYTTVSLFTTPGSNRGDNKATGSLPTADPGTTYQSFGGTADDWFPAGSWTEAEVESSNFGVALCFTANAANTRINIDHIRITVTYTVEAVTPADLSWDTGAADFEIWAGATATTDAILTWDNGTLVCSTSLNDDNTRQSTCGSINKSQIYRIQTVLSNVGGTSASMAAGDFVDNVNVQTFWAGTTATLTDCGFADGGTFGGVNDDTSAACTLAYNATNNARITQTGTEVLIAATTGKEGFMYRITTDDDVSLSDSSTYMDASIDSITEDSSRVTIGVIRKPGLHVRGWAKIRGLVKFR